MAINPFTHRSIRVVWAAAFLLSLVGVTACEEKNTYQPPPPPKVTVVKPVQKPVSNVFEFTGNIAATNTVDLRARVEGYLAEVLFEDGQIVNEGDRLFVIERAPYLAAVNRAKADLARAEASELEAIAEAERNIRAGKTGAVSKQQVDQAVAKREMSSAQVLAMRAELEKALLDLSYTEVRAPFTGRIGRRLKDPGNLVGTGENTLIAQINKIDPVYVYFTIDEQKVQRIREQHGTAAKPDRSKPQVLELGLANEEGFPHQGRLDFADITVDPTTGTLQLRGVFENPNAELLPGYFARIRAPIGDPKPALLVPQTAVAFDQQGPHVMLVNPQNIVERRGVELGPIQDDLRVITKGLESSDSIISVGLQRAIPGREVNPVLAGTTTPADTGTPAKNG